MLQNSTRTEKNMTRFIVSSLILLAVLALILAGGTIAVLSHLSNQIELVALQKSDLDALQTSEIVEPKIVVAGQVSGSAWEQGRLVIVHSAVLEDSLIFVTPITKPRGNWWVAQIVPGESFTVESSADDENMSFNWLITASPNQSG
ncbi:MAG TPA: hypothetical protein VK003_08160 [Oceanobacillus sp.]|nr:hypothetical protein [Oceanobacillus sp.]